MKLASAIQKFTDDPGSFLKNNCVIIAGGTSRPPGPTIFRMVAGTSVVKGKTLGVMSARALWTVNISNNNGGTPGPGVVLGPDEFVGYYIPMKQQGDSVANIFGQPPMDGSLTLLLTSQLTGCTFGFSTLGGQMVASHLQPLTTADRPTNERNMASITQAGMGGTARLVQKGTDYQDIATVAGKWNGREWKLYMQRIDWNPGKGGNGFKELKGVSRL